MLEALPTLPDSDLRTTPDAGAGFGALRTERGALPLVALEVDGYIDGLIASVDLTQTYFNSHDQPLEATYVFPLPDRAAVTSFRLEVAGRVVEGQLQERGQARRTYDAAVKAGHRTAIAEEERAGVFTMRVGNLPPGERATVRLTLVGPLPYSDGEVTFRFPLVVAPRYVPGTPLPGPQAGSGVAADTDASPDASRISPPTLLPGFPNPVRLGISVTLADSPLTPHSFRSSLHTVIEEKSGHGRRFRVEPGERLDRDFILRWRLGGEGIGTSLVTRPDATGGEGTWMLTVVPPAHLGEKVRPREVVFVLDRSGSMSGWKMVAARRAVSRMVETLTERDRFTVYAFDTRIETPPGFDGVTLVPATDRQRYRAAEFLAGVDAEGGTEMDEPLRKAAIELTRGGAAGVDRVLVLITDGQVSNEDQILKSLAPYAGKVRIFTLGIDRAVNAAFLRRLADLGGGASEVVESEQRLDEVMDQIHRNVGTPVLTGLTLSGAGLDVIADSLVPSRLPDLFAGAPVVIAGRYRGSAGGVVLRALDADGEKWAGETMARCEEKAPLDKVWGRGRVRELEDRYAAGTAARGQLEREIVATALKCGVLSRFTAYVAVDRAEVVNRGGETKKVTQAVETPAGWGQAEALMAQAAPPAPAEMLASAQIARGGTARAFGLASAVAKPAQPRTAGAASPPPSDRTMGGINAPPPPTGAMPEAAADESLDFELDDEGTTCTDYDESEQVISRARRRAPRQQPQDADPTMWQRVKSFFGIGGKAKQKKDATPDVQALRTRAESLRVRLEAASDAAAQLAVLRATQAELYELVRDLLQAGDTSAALTKLANHVKNVAQLLAAPTPGDDLLRESYQGIVAALREWLGVEDEAPPKSGAREFWK